MAGEAGFIRVEIDGKTTAIKPSEGARIMRGQVGKDVLDVKLDEFARGDHIVAVVESRSGLATSVKAFHGRVQGTLSRRDGKKLVLGDGRIVTLAPEPQIVLPDGKIGKSEDLKAGAPLVCRVNPITGEAWTVVAAVATRPVASATRPTTSPAKPEPADGKPRIRSVTYSAPSPIRPGDLITVDLAGTPGGSASFEVKRLLGTTPMKEVSPGSYRAVAEVPQGKKVVGAPLIGRLAANEMQASPVQASRLVTVVAADVEPVASGDGVEPVPAEVSNKPPGPDPVTNPPTWKSDEVAMLPQPPVPDPPPVEAIAPAKAATPTASIVTAVPVASAAPAVVVPIESAAPTVPTAPRQRAKVILTNPRGGANIQRAILVRGTADPESKVKVTVTYNNGKAGILKLAGRAASEDLAVKKDGTFRMGPLPLEGPLATKGLVFTIKAYYPDRKDHGTAMVRVVGSRD